MGTIIWDITAVKYIYMYRYIGIYWATWLGAITDQAGRAQDFFLSLSDIS